VEAVTFTPVTRADGWCDRTMSWFGFSFRRCGNSSAAPGGGTTADLARSVNLSVHDRKGEAMELRDIEIFLTLAQELHFGRTAERLHVSPARVSQAIKKQERLIGAELFTRTSRNVRLTPVGERLRADLAPVYRRAQGERGAGPDGGRGRHRDPARRHAGHQRP
jgi:Bacterial regulatory helix-turn-helix protein, lysR family